VSAPGHPERRRATRLLRWYPPAWRGRYGAEFTELLVAELVEHPRSWRRTADVALGGTRARLASAGLCGGTLDPDAQVRASIATLGCALGLFFAFAVAVWAQLTIGWQWSRPDTQSTAVAVITMSVLIALFLILAALAALPIAWSVLIRVRGRQAATLWAPSLLFVVGVAALVIGSRHFAQHGWPGTDGHPWAGRGLLSGAVGAFAWAATLSISAYWAHPGALFAFPAGEVAWMALSPVAMVAVAVGASKILRRLPLSPGVLRYEARLGSAAAATMIAFLVASSLWIADGGTGPRDLFHTGAIDIVAVVVMGLALTAAHRAVRRARTALLALSIPH